MDSYGFHNEYGQLIVFIVIQTFRPQNNGLSQWRDLDNIYNHKYNKQMTEILIMEYI